MRNSFNKFFFVINHTINRLEQGQEDGKEEEDEGDGRLHVAPTGCGGCRSLTAGD